MKKVIALLLILLILVGCGRTTRDESESGEDKRFVTIDTRWSYLIVADVDVCVTELTEVPWWDENFVAGMEGYKADRWERRIDESRSKGTP